VQGAGGVDRVAGRRERRGGEINGDDGGSTSPSADLSIDGQISRTTIGPWQMQEHRAWAVVTRGSCAPEQATMVRLCGMANSTVWSPPPRVGYCAGDMGLSVHSGLVSHHCERYPSQPTRQARVHDRHAVVLAISRNARMPRKQNRRCELLFLCGLRLDRVRLAIYIYAHGPSAKSTTDLPDSERGRHVYIVLVVTATCAPCFPFTRPHVATDTCLPHEIPESMHRPSSKSASSIDRASPAPPPRHRVLHAR